MNNYHILYKKNADDEFSTGINIVARDEAQSIEFFRLQFKDEIFLCMYSSEIFYKLIGFNFK